MSSHIQGEWVSSPCTEEYVAVQIGLALAYATDNQCHPLRHCVDLDAKKERFSLASFFSPSMDKPLRNYKTGEIVAECFGDLVKQNVEDTYKDN